MTTEYERAWERAHKLAQTRLDGCFSALYAVEDDDPAIAADPSCAPFCGCSTCVVRETLDAAYPKLETHFAQKSKNKTIFLLIVAFILGTLFASNITAFVIGGY
jgi:hypothetical protein